jgi:hypothetical protein
MTIGLIDVDGRNFPNLVLMKISAYHKSLGDRVEWYDAVEGIGHYQNTGCYLYGKVYMSKVFTFTPDYDTVIAAAQVIRGGTGYRDFTPLPDYIDRLQPDYTLYPGFTVDVAKKKEPFALGFLTRGCPNRCPWCIVPEKEGMIRPYMSWEEIKRPDSRAMVLMDNNVLACSWGKEQIFELGFQNIWVDFNQGLDARLITPFVARLLKKLKWIRFIRMSCDTSAMLPVIEQATAYMREAGIGPSRFWCYVLVTDVGEAERRVLTLRAMGVTPFAQPYRAYDNTEPTEEQKQFAQWVNKKSQFNSCEWKDYKKPGWKKQNVHVHEAACLGAGQRP